MEYPTEYPSSDKSTLYSQPSVDPNEQGHGRIVARTEPEFFSSTLEERLRSDEAFLRQASENLEQRRAEAEQLHRAYDENERLAALEASPRRVEPEPQQRNEKEQKLLAQIDALREAETQQRQRIEEATAATRGRFAEENGPKADEAIECANSLREDEETQLAQLETLRAAAEAETGVLATEKERLNAEIKALSQVASQQIDRMEEAKTRLAILEELRIHAEKRVWERAEREIRLEAEIEALRQIEATQVQRIEAAEAEVQRLTEEQTRMQAAAEAHRIAEAEARQRAAAAAVQELADEARRRAEEEEQGLEHLEAIRARAEAAAQERAEKERQLNAQLLAFGEAAAEQLMRIKSAEADLRGAEEELLQFEEKARQTAEQVAIRLGETELRRRAAAEEFAHTEAESQALAREEEQRLAELESVRSQAEIGSQRRQEEERRLMAEIETLRQIEAEQLNRIADAEAALLTGEVESPAARVGVSEEVQPKTEFVANSPGKSEAGPNNLHSHPPAAETLWSIFEHYDQSGDDVAEEVDLPGNDSVESPLELSEIPTKDSAEEIDSVLLEEGIKAASPEIPLVNLLAERLSSSDPEEHASAIQELGRLEGNAAFNLITGLFDDGSEDVRNAAVRALYELSTERADIFTRALREASPQRRRQIVTALDASGLAAEAIDRLAGESREKTHDAFSMLFLMAKAGEVQSLFQTIEKHPNLQVRLSVIKLLTFSNRTDIIPTLRSLAVRAALPIEVRSALMKSIYEMSSDTRERSVSAT